MPGGGDDDDVSPQERSHSVWLEKNRAVNKRIGRITRKYDQQLAEQEARHQREMRELSDRVNSLKTTRGGEGGNADEAAHEREMAALQKDYERALENGDSTKAAELHRQMTAKEAKFWHDRTVATMGGDKGRRDSKRQDDGSQDDRGQQQRRQPSRAGLAFTEANDWWDDPDYKVEKAGANAIFATMIDEEGYDPDDPRTYAKLAKRLGKKFKNLEIVVPGRDDDDDEDEDDDDDGDDDASTRRGARARASQAAVHSVSRRDDARPARRNGQMHLTEADFSTMRQIGLNPDNNDHCMEFALGKREAEQQERSRR